MSPGWQQLWQKGDRGQLAARSTPATPHARVTLRKKLRCPWSRRGAGPCWLLEVCTGERPWQQPRLPCSSQGYFLCFLCFFFFLGALPAFPERLGLLLEG